jgi:His-Xaa-Ser system protein HxsD
MSMSSVRGSFDLGAYSVDAVQRAAYRFSDRASAEITVGDSTIEVEMIPIAEDADGAALLAELRSEALDQVLREKIRDETADVRSLVLALAFSRTGLAETDG